MFIQLTFTEQTTCIFNKIRLRSNKANEQSIGDGGGVKGLGQTHNKNNFFLTNRILIDVSFL